MFSAIQYSLHHSYLLLFVFPPSFPPSLPPSLSPLSSSISLFLPLSLPPSLPLSLLPYISTPFFSSSFPPPLQENIVTAAHSAGADVIGGEELITKVNIVESSDQS